MMNSPSPESPKLLIDADVTLKLCRCRMPIVISVYAGRILKGETRRTCRSVQLSKLIALRLAYAAEVIAAGYLPQICATAAPANEYARREALGTFAPFHLLKTDHA